MKEVCNFLSLLVFYCIYYESSFWRWIWFSSPSFFLFSSFRIFGRIASIIRDKFGFMKILVWIDFLFQITYKGRSSAKVQLFWQIKACAKFNIKYLAGAYQGSQYFLFALHQIVKLKLNPSFNKKFKLIWSDYRK